MRVLSLGHPLPNPLVDNHSIFNAPTIFDYEAIVVDPSGVLDSIQSVVDSSGQHLTHSDVPVINGEPNVAATGIADVLRRRREEFSRALARNAVVVVFTYPQVTLTGVSGFSGCDRYFFLPAPSGMGWDSTLIRGGEGTTVSVVDHGHPFAPVCDALNQDLLYRAYFDDRAPGFADAGRIFARSAGGAPIGVQFRVGGGTVIFVPTIKTRSNAPASSLATVMVEAIHELMLADDTDQPHWLADQDLPGLKDLESEEVFARERRDTANQALVSAENDVLQLGRMRDILWKKGQYGLLPAVLHCMALLGFEEEESSSNESSSVQRLRSPKGDLYVTVEASSEAVDMTPHYRLRQRLDSLIEVGQGAPRGLIVVNGQRLVQPDRRDIQYEESLKVAAEATGYALLTTTDLFIVSRWALESDDDRTLTAIQERIVMTDGLLRLPEILDEGIIEPDSD